MGHQERETLSVTCEDYCSLHERGNINLTKHLTGVEFFFPHRDDPHQSILRLLPITLLKQLPKNNEPVPFAKKIVPTLGIRGSIPALAHFGMFLEFRDR